MVYSVTVTVRCGKFTILPRYSQRRGMPGALTKLNRTGKLTPPTTQKDTKFPSALHSLEPVYKLLVFFQKILTLS